MKNILNEKPNIELNGRARHNLNFIQDRNIVKKRILDIGCGYGWFTFNILNKGPLSISGIDPNKSDISKAKKYIADKRATFKVGDALNIPYENEQFDTAVSWEVIEHLPKNREYLMFKEANRILKPKGIFYLSTPYDDFTAKLLDPAWWLIGHRHYSSNKLNDVGIKSGFMVEQIYIGGGIWEIVNVNNRLISKWIFRREPFFNEFINNKRNKEFGTYNGFTNIFVRYRKVSS